MTRPHSRRHAPETILTGGEIRDPSRLLAEIIALHRQLAGARLRAANLEAAILAALRADEDGESDPLGFLRDELAVSGGGDAFDA